MFMTSQPAPVHPGEILRERLPAPARLSADALAQAVGVPPSVVEQLACNTTPTAAAAERILVVDDNETNRDILGERLTANGYEVLHAGDGEQALAMARLHRPDLILLDIIMPKMDGIQACRRIKGDAALSLTRCPLWVRRDCADRIRRPSLRLYCGHPAALPRTTGWGQSGPDRAIGQGALAATPAYARTENR
jgi:hypothetical protein